METVTTSLVAYDTALAAARAKAKQAEQARVQTERTLAQRAQARAQVLAQVRAHGVEAKRLRKECKESSKRLHVSEEGWDSRTRAS